jgi:hypothetical protein
VSSPIRFDRKPYIVSYVDADGKQQRIRRVPPPKLHTAMPEDVVELKRRKSDHFIDGDSVTVKHINPRHPNVLKVENDQGQTTFISHYEMVLKQKIANTRDVRDDSIEDQDSTPNIDSSYLDWP